MRPSACPRCARAPDTWTFERDQGVAGCPCGEVIPYAFDDAPLEPLSAAPTKPKHWVEDARTDGFTATLAPNLRWVWYAIPLILLFAGWRLALSGLALGGIPGMVIALAAMASLIAWNVAQSARRWTFAIEGGRFRAQARGSLTDIALEEIQRFDVAPRPEKRRAKAADAGAAFQLVVTRTSGDRTRVPLFVESAADAQFVADRVNTMLATDGRTVDGDYRGQHVRVGDVGTTPVRVETETREELADSDADVDADAERRRARI